MLFTFRFQYCICSHYTAVHFYPGKWNMLLLIVDCSANFHVACSLFFKFFPLYRILSVASNHDFLSFPFHRSSLILHVRYLFCDAFLIHTPSMTKPPLYTCFVLAIHFCIPSTLIHLQQCFPTLANGKLGDFNSQNSQQRLCWLWNS